MLDEVKQGTECTILDAGRVLHPNIMTVHGCSFDWWTLFHADYNYGM